ncbi:hypothetical protein ACFWHQ_32350 [Streptomyces sp. NPDC060334]|uniref:hypothetical protein n=1 Tax=Streptomyces sp. NPDC060334 TaxID=3347099 RepID=UPI00364CFC54
MSSTPSVAASAPFPVRSVETGGAAEDQLLGAAAVEVAPPAPSAVLVVGHPVDLVQHVQKQLSPLRPHAHGQAVDVGQDGQAVDLGHRGVDRCGGGVFHDDSDDQVGSCAVSPSACLGQCRGVDDPSGGCDEVRVEAMAAGRRCNVCRGEFVADGFIGQRSEFHGGDAEQVVQDRRGRTELVEHEVPVAAQEGDAGHADGAVDHGGVGYAVVVEDDDGDPCVCVARHHDRAAPTVREPRRLGAQAADGPLGLFGRSAAAALEPGPFCGRFSEGAVSSSDLHDSAHAARKEKAVAEFPLLGSRAPEGGVGWGGVENEIGQPHDAAAW